MTALRFPAASYYLERWLSLTPDYPQALLLKGQLQVRYGNQQEAIALFGRVLELDPERDDARLQLAAQYLELVQADKARPHLDWLRRRLPGNAIVDVESARCLDLLGEPEEARRLLDDVLSRQPLLAAALLERGRLALRAQELDDAEHYLRAACKRDPGNYEAHFKLMQCLRSQEKHAEADGALKKKKHAEADAALEMANRVKSDGTRLREIATGALALRPRDPALHAEIGEILLRLGHLEQGQRWLESALQIDPRHAGAHRRWHSITNRWGSRARRSTTVFWRACRSRKGQAMNPWRLAVILLLLGAAGVAAVQGYAWHHLNAAAALPGYQNEAAPAPGKLPAHLARQRAGAPVGSPRRTPRGAVR